MDARSAYRDRMTPQPVQRRCKAARNWPVAKSIPCSVRSSLFNHSTGKLSRKESRTSISATSMTTAFAPLLTQVLEKSRRSGLDRTAGPGMKRAKRSSGFAVVPLGRY